MPYSAAISSLANQGYCLLQNHFSAPQLQALKNEAEQLIESHYSRENLAAHSVYPSDSTDTRVSHAMMISEGPSPFPKVAHQHCPTVNKLLQDHNALLQQISGSPVAPGARCMLNYQNYFSGSKPVGEHFDGEYMRAQKAEDGIEFKLLEGILPRYVAVLVLSNENQGKGTELVDNALNVVHRPRMDPGDLLLFDNIRLRHRVPTMEKPRITIGLRNFDHQAVHFAASENDFLNNDYQAIPEGWVSHSVDCQARFAKFMQEDWPKMQADYQHYF